MQTSQTFLDALLSPIPASSRLRGAMLVVVGGMAWLLGGMVAHPPAVLDAFVVSLFQFISSLISFPFQAGGLDRAVQHGLVFGIGGYLLAGQVLRAMFSADVMRHGLALLAPFYLAYRAAILVVATIHLDEVGDPADLRTASLYTRHAAFGVGLLRSTLPGRGNPNRIGRLVIENGGVLPNPALAGQAQDPVHRIGGPGWVQVNLENVAIFDRANGETHIIGPAGNSQSRACLLEDFERLREVIDLRDQLTSISASAGSSSEQPRPDGTPLSLTNAIEGRTRDGIRILVRDVRVVFSVQRSRASNPGDPASPPYSYREDAIRRLVYSRGTGPWTEAMLGLVKDQLQSFIASHSLSQILAATGLPEVEAQQMATTQIIRTAAMFFPGYAAENDLLSAPPETAGLRVGGPPLPILPDELDNQEGGWVPRLELTDLFYNSAQGFPGRASQFGVQLQWIDVGTWSVPASAITEKQVEAWRMSIENETRRRNLKSIESESRLEELLRLIREVPLIRFAEAKQEGKPAQEVTAGLISDYLGLLRAAVDVYAREGAPTPTRLANAVDLIARGLQAYLKDNGQAKYL